MPKGTADKVYTAGVSPINKCCLMMAKVWAKHIAARTTNVYIVDDILKHLTNTFSELYIF